MILSKENISNIKAGPDLIIPQREILELPEKVLAFGTGVLLRGLPNYLIDKANRRGVFNGRIVVVKSTDKGSTEAFAQQNGLYTICVQGIQEGKSVDQKIINASVSRVVSATAEWDKILACARDKNIQVVISNATEAGVKLAPEDRLTDQPPASFPGKLLAFMYERYKAFGGSLESGLVILPTELIPDNGKVLKNIVLDLAKINSCEQAFVEWLHDANEFCSTLVDRIVPGALPQEEHSKMQRYLGYEDQLMIMAEPYRLWAIETSRQRTRDILSFAQVDSSVVLSRNINKHREIKLRLLNAPHTFSCGMALWCGLRTVKEAMGNMAFRGFISELMYNEIVPVLAGDEITEDEARAFADKVLDRFSNPNIAHEWLSISMQYTSKMAMRCIPLLLAHYKKHSKFPRSMAMGFAAYILFMKSEERDGKYIGKIQDQEYNITDDKAAILHKHWLKEDLAKVVYAVLSDKNLWGTDLSDLPDFRKGVFEAMELLNKK